MILIDKIKDIIYKIKDYDRLESDYCTCLDYATDSKMSKPNYHIETVKTVISDTISEYIEEGYDMAVEIAIEWLDKNYGRFETKQEAIEDFKNNLKED